MTQGSYIFLENIPVGHSSGFNLDLIRSQPNEYQLSKTEEAVIKKSTSASSAKLRQLSESFTRAEVVYGRSELDIAHANDLTQRVNKLIDVHNNRTIPIMKWIAAILVIPYLIIKIFNLDTFKHINPISVKQFGSHIADCAQQTHFFSTTTDLVKNNEKITALYLQKVQKDQVEQLVKCLKSNHTLTSIRIEDSYLGEEDIAKICGALRNKINLKELSFSNVPLSSSVSKVSELVSSLDNLEKVNLSKCRLKGSDEKQVITLSHALKNCRKLRFLNLGENNLAGAGFLNKANKYNGIRQLVKNLTSLPALETLSVRANYFDDHNVSQFADLIAKSPALKTFDISWNYMGKGEASQKFGKALASNRRLEKISFFHNLLEETDVLQLSNGIRTSHVKFVDIAANGILGDSKSKHHLEKNAFNNEVPRLIRYDASARFVHGLSAFIVSANVAVAISTYVHSEAGLLRNFKN